MKITKTKIIFSKDDMYKLEDNIRRINKIYDAGETCPEYEVCDKEFPLLSYTCNLFHVEPPLEIGKFVGDNRCIVDTLNTQWEIYKLKKVSRNNPKEWVLSKLRKQFIKRFIAFFCFVVIACVDYFLQFKVVADCLFLMAIVSAVNIIYKYRTYSLISASSDVSFEVIMEEIEKNKDC